MADQHKAQWTTDPGYWLRVTSRERDAEDARVQTRHDGAGKGVYLKGVKESTLASSEPVAGQAGKKVPLTVI